MFGPPPDWATFRQMAETDVAARLIDPESARFSWSGGYYKGAFKPFLSARVTGYVACGLVNAKNRMGGYTGYGSFVVVIDYDRVLYAEVDRGTGVGLIGMACGKAQQQGLIPPLPAGAAGTTSTGTAAGSTDATVTSASSGLTLRAMPDGAYVSAVATGSPAAAAGMKPGMVVTSVNAIPLAGMGDAMLKVMDAAGAGAALTLVGGTAVRLGSRQCAGCSSLRARRCSWPGRPRPASICMARHRTGTVTGSLPRRNCVPGCPSLTDGRSSGRTAMFVTAGVTTACIPDTLPAALPVRAVRYEATIR